MERVGARRVADSANLRAGHVGGQVPRFAVRRDVVPDDSRSAPATLSIALLTSSDLGNPLFPVAKISPLRRAMNAPCGTVMHHTTPA